MNYLFFNNQKEKKRPYLIVQIFQKNQVSGVDRGETTASITTLSKICKALNIPIHELFT